MPQTPAPIALPRTGLPIGGNQSVWLKSSKFVKKMTNLFLLSARQAFVWLTLSVSVFSQTKDPVLLGTDSILTKSEDSTIFSYSLQPIHRQYMSVCLVMFVWPVAIFGLCVSKTQASSSYGRLLSLYTTHFAFFSCFGTLSMWAVEYVVEKPHRFQTNILVGIGVTLLSTAYLIKKIKKNVPAVSYHPVVIALLAMGAMSFYLVGCVAYYLA